MFLSAGYFATGKAEHVRKAKEAAEECSSGSLVPADIAETYAGPGLSSCFNPYGPCPY